MDRKIIYPGQIPLETDLLDTNRFALIGLGKLAAAVLGTTTLVNGLACTPTAPASMQVQVAPGEIYSLQNLDGTAYSSLAADTTHSLLKQGLLMDAVNLACPAPTTSGYSVNYLVQVIYQDVDALPVTLPYYNASNPTQAYTGPNNSGTAQNTVRKGVCTVSVKAGIAATTGTQQTPAPDVGYVGLYSVTVAYGQASITADNIAAVSGAPILSETLLNKISQATGDARYATQTGFQQNAYSVANAGGTADAITATYSPVVTAPTNGMTLNVRATAANATTTPTFTPASGTIAAKTIVKGAGAALAAGDIAGGGHWIELQYDAALDKWVLLNPANGVSPASQQAGEVCFFARNTAPAGFLKANGAAVSRTTYAALFAAIGTTFGAGDGSTTFNLPDLRGEFLRGFDDARGVDSGRALGSWQAPSLTNVQNGTAYDGNGAINVDIFELSQADATAHFDNYGVAKTAMAVASITSGGSVSRTPYAMRPRNVALLACIKY